MCICMHAYDTAAMGSKSTVLAPRSALQTRESSYPPIIATRVDMNEGGVSNNARRNEHLCSASGDG